MPTETPTFTPSPTLIPSPTSPPTATNTPGPSPTSTTSATATPGKKTPTSIPAPTETQTLVPTPTPPYYYIPSELLGQRFGLYKCTAVYGDCDPPELPDEVQARVGDTVFTTIDGTRAEITLQSVSHSIKQDRWREFITTFEFYNPSDNVLTIASEEFFDAWGDFGNWRGAIVVLNTEANFEIHPGLTVIDIQWTTEARKNLLVWITINSQMDGRYIILDENSAIYRVEFPPVPTSTPTPTRTPMN